MKRVPVIGVDDVTGRTAAGPVITGLIVCSQQRQHRVEEPGFLQSEEYRISSQIGAKPPRAQQVLRSTGWRFRRIGQSYLGCLATAPLKGSQDVSRLSYLPSRQRVEIRENPFPLCLFRCRRRHSLQPLRKTINSVALSESIILERE